MGRSGGGGRSGGRSGGGRSSGGRSSGGFRSSGGRSSSGRSLGLGGSPRSGNRGGFGGGFNTGLGFGMGSQMGRNIMGGGNNNRGYGGGRRNNSANLVGCLVPAIIFIIILVAFFGLLSPFLPSNDIPRSTSERTKITTVADGDVLTYVDDTRYGDWFPNARSMEAGANEAFRLTGVKFGVYVANDINGDFNPSDSEMEAFADNLYTELFGNSSGHFLLTLIDTGEGNFIAWFTAGSAASTIFDGEALDILAGYLSYNWERADPDRINPISESEMFGNTLSSTAARIMTVTPTAMQTIAPWLFLLSGIVVVFMGITIVMQMNTKRKLAAAEQAKADAELLATPIDGLDGAPPHDPLLDKYKE